MSEAGDLQERYQRNIGTLGAAGQRRLHSAHVVIVGLGGLGGHVLEQTARSGVGIITALDPDVFEATNLNRQLLCDEGSLGVPKVDAAAARVSMVHSPTKLSGLQIRHSEAPSELWSQADLVFDCLDSIADRLSLARICADAGVTLVHGAVAGWYGQAALVQPGSGLMARIYRYREQETGLEAELGTPPFTVALAASFMVSLGIREICSMNPEDRGDTVYLLDLEANTIELSMLPED